MSSQFEWYEQENHLNVFLDKDDPIHFREKLLNLYGHFFGACRSRWFCHGCEQFKLNFVFYFLKNCSEFAFSNGIEHLRKHPNISLYPDLIQDMTNLKKLYQVSLFDNEEMERSIIIKYSLHPDVFL